MQLNCDKIGNISEDLRQDRRQIKRKIANLNDDIEKLKRKLNIGETNNEVVNHALRNIRRKSNAN